MKSKRHLNQRRQAAREAADLIFTGQEKEYKQAKLRASRIVGTNILPSNLEVASELDRISYMREGEAKQQRLVESRYLALKVMQVLKAFHPLIVGSVWRGTAYHDSDLDITVFAENPEKVVNALQKSEYNITSIENRKISRKSEAIRCCHIYMYVQGQSNKRIEVVVRSLSERTIKPRCEIYGDLVTGLTIEQLKRVLEEEPVKRFVPL